MAPLPPSFGDLSPRENAALTLALLERLAIPIVIVTPSCSVVWSNSGCARFIAEAGQLRLVDNRLCPAAQEQVVSFGAFMSRKKSGNRGRLGPDVFLLRTVDGEDGALLIRLAAAPSHESAPGRGNGDCQHAAEDQIIGIFDLKGSAAHENDVAQHLYGLTPAEHMLCVSIAAGDDLKSWARKRHVSLHTVRTQLKSVFRKMGAARQQDIVRIWLSLGMVNCGLAAVD
jgi:DNA-binding CsgD family transcriptional regulator